MNWKQYIKNVKQSSYNLLLDLFIQEKPISTAEWFLYVASYMEGKVEELYNDNTGILKDYEDTFCCTPSLTYMTEVLREVNIPNDKKLTIKEYNSSLKNIGKHYVDNTLNKELTSYIKKKATND